MIIVLIVKVIDAVIVIVEVIVIVAVIVIIVVVIVIVIVTVVVIVIITIVVKSNSKSNSYSNIQMTQPHFQKTEKESMDKLGPDAELVPEFMASNGPVANPDNTLLMVVGHWRNNEGKAKKKLGKKY